VGGECMQDSLWHVLFKRFYKKGYTVSHIFEMINIIPTVCKGPEVIVAILQM
jgi:hypothetical protein